MCSRPTYLNGDLHIQLYGRTTTSELRLVGFPEVSMVEVEVPEVSKAEDEQQEGGKNLEVKKETLKKTRTKKKEVKVVDEEKKAPVVVVLQKKLTYKLRLYDRELIENCSATFNTFYRSHAGFSFGEDSDSFFSALRRMDDDSFSGYDEVAEYSIALSMENGDVRETIETIGDSIDMFIRHKTTPEACAASSFRSFCHKKNIHLPIAKKYIDACHRQVIDDKKYDEKKDDPGMILFRRSNKKRP